MYATVIATADENGWDLNPNEKTVALIVKGLESKESRLGSAFCPCSLETTPEMVCPCESAATDIAKDGHCNCRLFYQRTECLHNG